MSSNPVLDCDPWEYGRSQTRRDAPGPTGSLRAWDVGASKEVACVQEFMESYEIVCFAPGCGDQGASEIVAGAVHGGAGPKARHPCTFGCEPYGYKG